MRLSVRWLKHLINVEIDVQKIIDTLTMAGIEVEEVVDLGMLSGRIVVAKVLEVAPHPDADRLRVCRVDIGTGEPVMIVCGAPNVTAGVLYPCALPGARLPEGLEIRKSKIRGQVSEGMLCSARELGLGTDHSGIMDLPESYGVGEPFDCLLDLKVTPNRPDWLSVFGVARELGAMIGEQVFPPKPRLKETVERIEGFVQLFITARAECPRYACRLVRGVKVGESPLWLRRALEASGLRSINNVVDVTNYVLLELGHPLHAFDYKRLAGSEIRVRMAEPGEPITLIDGTRLELTAEDLVIADAERPAALAGIMGGFDSEVTAETVDVLLEAAYFNPVTIRRTARRYGLQTDASYRFERGTDREKLLQPLARAAQLIQEVAGGEIIKGVLDIQNGSPDATPIALDVERVNQLLGIKLTSTEIADYLVYLGFEIRRAERASLIVSVPSHRVDVSREIDLIEEIARLYGYNKIPVTVPRARSVPAAPSLLAQLADRVVDVFVALGFHEAMTYSFVSEAAAEAVGADPAQQPHVANPLTVDQAIMRPSILTGLLEAVVFNQKQGESRVMLFEVGKTWRPGAVAGDPAGERQEAALVWSGTTPLHWGGPPRAIDFYDVKGVVESLFSTLGRLPLTFEPLTDHPAYHPGRSARVVWGGRPVGQVGEAHPDLAEKFDLKGRVCQLCIDLDAVLGLWDPASLRLRPTPRFPGSWRDLALVVDADVPAGALLATVRKGAGELHEDSAIFDVYQGEHVPVGKKSLALRVWLRSQERTLTEEEIQQTMDAVLQRLTKEHGATLRS